MADHEPTIVIASDAAEAGQRAAESFIDALNENVEEGRERHFVALAGGSTPEVCYHALAEPPLRDRFDPARIEWFFSDERCVPPDHPDSNYCLARRSLLAPLGVGLDSVHRMPADEDDLTSAAAHYERTLRSQVPTGPSGLPAFDIIFLGLGADGHTASLFPGSSALEERHRLVKAHRIEPHGVWRMTMTFPILWAARRLFVLATGANKAEAVAAVLSPEPNANRWPAAALRDGSSAVTWFLDADAGHLVERRSGA